MSGGTLSGGATDPVAWIVTTLTGVLIILYFIKALSSAKRLPGPLFQIPILGDSIALVKSDPARFLFRRLKKYGKTFRVSLMGLDVCTIADAEVLRPLLNGDGAEFRLPVESFKALVSDHPVQEDKPLHGSWRKAFTAAVTGKNLAALVPGVVEVMERNVNKWAAAGRVELFSAGRRLALDLGVDALSGFDLASKQLDLEWFKDQTAVYLNGLYSLPVALPGTALTRALAAKKRLLAALRPVLGREQEEFEAQWRAAGGSAADLASKYVAAEEKVTTGQAVVLGLYATGHSTRDDVALSVLHTMITTVDTTKAGVFNTLALLAIRPGVQDKIFEEQKKVVEAWGPELSYKAVMGMPYLDAVFKECMRILPASAGGFRLLTRDLRTGDTTVPAGTWLMYIPVLMSLIDPVLWDGDTSVDIPPHMDWRNNLDTAFQPERWLSEETRPKHYYAFGSGAHLCIGMNLVHIEVKLLVALLLRRFRLVPECPDMLHRATSFFPFVQPAKGTDGVKLVPREAPLA